MDNFEHFDSLEFDLAEKIWHSADDKESRIKAISFYKMAAFKRDARAFLALYKINSEWKTSYLVTGRQHNSLPYLFGALKLGFVPAFLYAGNLDVFSKYERLIYFSTGLALAKKTKDSLLDELQNKFIESIDDFAIEFIPEIIQRGQQWIPGDLPNTSNSLLDRQLVEHPFKYEPGNDKVHPKWTIFHSSIGIEQYLKHLPASDDYFLAYKFEKEGDADSRDHYLSIAALKGNGQALYATNEHYPKLLIKAAQNGSPDAFEDLMCAMLPDISSYNNFKNFSESQVFLEDDFASRIDCLLYLYSLMERLGIERNAYYIDWMCLSSDSETGYSYDSFPMSDLKYKICGHEQIVEINDRAARWRIGDNFDAKFHKLFDEIFIDNDCSN